MSHKITYYDTIEKELISLANNYNSPLLHLKSLISVRQYRPLYEIFSRYVPKGSKVLDWGAGNGHFSYFLCRLEYQATGFSMEEFSFKNLVEDFGYKFIKGPVNKPSKLPFPTNLFDCAVSVGVLEHVREFGGTEIKSMKEIRRVLKPEGVFICCHLPNKYSLVEFLGGLFKDKFHHQWKFGEDDIKDLCKQSNLNLLEAGRYGILPRNSLSNLPFFRTSKIFAQIYDHLDKALSLLLNPVCQNYYFAARKSR